MNKVAKQYNQLLPPSKETQMALPLNTIGKGEPLPLGTKATQGGVNFAFFSRHGTRVRLELYETVEDSTPTQTIDLDPEHHRTGDVWHVWIAKIQPGQLYGYRVDGPYEPKQGHRFNGRPRFTDDNETGLFPIECIGKSPHRARIGTLKNMYFYFGRGDCIQNRLESL